MSESLQKALSAYQTHCDKINTVIIGSVDEHGTPLASYAPYVMDEQKHIYVLLSGMSPHSGNLESTAKASALFIEDESKTTNMFARKRLSFNCSVSIIDPNDPEFDRIADLMYDRHGTIIERMRLLPDFRIFHFTPKDGRFVIGFGAAYEVCGEHLSQLRHLDAGGSNPPGHAHTKMGSGHGHDERSSSRLPAVPRGKLGSGMKKMIVSHMNDNHSDSLSNIATVFGKLSDVQSASIISIDEIGMQLHVIQSTGAQDIRIEFDKPLADANKAHSTLVSMSIQAKQSLQS